MDACLYKPNYREIVDRLFTFTLVDVHETIRIEDWLFTFTRVDINETVMNFVIVCLQPHMFI